MWDIIHCILAAKHQNSSASSPGHSGVRRRGQRAALLLGCLFLLGACTGLNGSHDSRLNLLMIHRPPVDISLRAQCQLQLETFQQWIGLLQQFHGQIEPYGQELLKDRHALDTAKSNTDYQKVLQTLQQHTASIQLPALKNEASYQLQQLTSSADSWGQAHPYHDDYNNKTYHMGYEYGPDGMAGWVQDELNSAKTITDYQQAIKDANISLTHFQAYQDNAQDTTPWSSPHQTDLQLMRHYQVATQKVVVISLKEQALRVYNNGDLVKAFHVTTGRPEKPSLPGFWSIESKQSPTVFRSDQPPGSPYWYPDTPIQYAMLYHSGGYFLHDSWWRADYGPNTQFPHYDSSGDAFSFDGSHGCINIASGKAAWVFNYVDINTPVIIY